MKKFDLPLVTDTLFYTAAAWLVLVGIFRWLRMQTWVCFTAATLLALALGVILFFLLGAKHRKRALGKKQRENREKLMLHLALERDERVRAALLEALLADGQNAHCERDALAVDGTPLIPIFTMQPVSADAVAHLLKEYGEQPFRIACNALTPEAEKLLCAFSFTYGMTAFAHFLDSSAVFSPDGTLKDRSEGCCRSLAAKTQSRKPKILGGKPKLLKT